ncbi:hypothetical protein [Marinivivus vitaminiproducens]|uniref:hypothetical protein n=1 Tax=Marinivivus vitaminiproducens TaxID=3035935 RepID=UPI00279FFC6C|nr:hypothetical protein P4R82_08125 [Geminicoccaceae bacterium SCSIO 64248]
MTKATHDPITPAAAEQVCRTSPADLAHYVFEFEDSFREALAHLMAVAVLSRAEDLSVTEGEAVRAVSLDASRHVDTLKAFYDRIVEGTRWWKEAA